MKTVKLFAAVIISAVMACASVGQVSAAGGQMNFYDVPKDSWYYNDVADAYALGMVNGINANTFSPNGELTIAETIKLAVSCYQQIMNGATTDIPSPTSNWYDGYVAYAMQKNIVTEAYESYTTPASRAQLAVLFSRVLTAAKEKADTDEINSITYGSLPDIGTDMWYANSVYRLYRLGILMGDENSRINPESKLRRSESAAIIMRMVDRGHRITKSSSSSAPESTPKVPAASQVTGWADSSSDSIMLYQAVKTAQSFTGETGVALDFTVNSSGGTVNLNGSYMAQIINNLELESDCISFRLYDGCGYEAFNIVRGWLNSCAKGVNGVSMQYTDDMYTTLNNLFFLTINGQRVPISSLWYADHRGDSTDGYTTYAFYFPEKINLSAVTDVRMICGVLDSTILRDSGMPTLAEQYTNKSLQEYDFASRSADASDSSTVSTALNTSLAKIKKNASEIIFEQKTDRCTAVYGKGLDGTAPDEYRLIIVFNNGAYLTISYVKLERIKFNPQGNILYYSIMGPDGKVLDSGMNFGD